MFDKLSQIAKNLASKYFRCASIINHNAALRGVPVKMLEFLICKIPPPPFIIYQRRAEQWGLSSNAAHSSRPLRHERSGKRRYSIVSQISIAEVKPARLSSLHKATHFFGKAFRRIFQSNDKQLNWSCTRCDICAVTKWVQLRIWEVYERPCMQPSKHEQ